MLVSFRLITGADGGEDKRTIYHPFGETRDWISDAAAAEETKGFIGERYDADAGLQYLNARYYDPELGLFMQPDWFEVTERGVGTNRYSYAFNDPINKMDPSGNSWVSDAWDAVKDWADNAFGGGAKSGEETAAKEAANSNSNVYEFESPEIAQATAAALSITLGVEVGFWELQAKNQYELYSKKPKEAAGGSPAAAAAAIAARALGKPASKVAAPKSLTLADIAGIRTYKELRQISKGLGVDVHHLIEKRFASLMGQAPREMSSMIVTKAEHQAITNAFREAIPYGSGTAQATKQTVLDTARKVYRDHPEILDALGLK